MVEHVHRSSFFASREFRSVMGENAVDPEIIKRTQDTLGQIISAPALTEKLLNRPPVQFLQDIVKAVG